MLAADSYKIYPIPLSHHTHLFDLTQPSYLRGRAHNPHKRVEAPQTSDDTRDGVWLGRVCVNNNLCNRKLEICKMKMFKIVWLFQPLGKPNVAKTDIFKDNTGVCTGFKDQPSLS